MVSMTVLPTDGGSLFKKSSAMWVQGRPGVGNGGSKSGEGVFFLTQMVEASLTKCKQKVNLHFLPG